MSLAAGALFTSPVTFAPLLVILIEWSGGEKGDAIVELKGKAAAAKQIVNKSVFPVGMMNPLFFCVRRMQTEEVGTRQRVGVWGEESGGLIYEEVGVKRETIFFP